MKTTTKRRKLTWLAGRGWKKVYKGRQLYFPAERKSEASYRDAWRQFELQRAEIDAAADQGKPHRAQYTKAIDLRQKLADACNHQLKAIERHREDFRLTGNVPRSTRDEIAWADAQAQLRGLLGWDEWQAPDDEPFAPFDSWGEFLAYAWTAYAPQMDIDAPSLADWRKANGTDDLPFTWEEFIEHEFSTRQKPFREFLRRMNDELAVLRKWFAQVSPRRLDQPDTLPVNPLHGESSETVQSWFRTLDVYDSVTALSEQVEADRTVCANVDRFVAAKRSEAQAGEIKPSTLQSIEGRLAHFKAFCGAADVEELTGSKLQDYRQELHDRIGRAECSQRMGKHLLDAAKAFTRWLAERGTIDRLPPMGRLTIAVDAKSPEVLSDEDLALLGFTDERMRLYVLLMLNCGMHQTDIAELRQAEVDWSEGRIKRKRSKTGKHGAVPVVNWLLWDETFRLLQKHKSGDGEIVLLNTNGSKLRRRELRNGKATNVDNVKDLYARRCRQAQVEQKPLKLLRSTAGSKLGESAEHSRFAQHFLGQAPATVADAHYVKPSQAQFDAAVIWLGEQFGFPTDRSAGQ